MYASNGILDLYLVVTNAEKDSPNVEGKFLG